MDRESPFEMVEDFLEQMEQEFETNPLDIGTRSIPVNLRDDGTRFVVSAELPGFDKDDIDVTLADQTLRIAVEAESTAESSGGEFLRRERRQQSASRSLRLPEPVEEAGIEASFTQGVLTVTLPKQEADAGTEIDIE